MGHIDGTGLEGDYSDVESEEVKENRRRLAQTTTQRSVNNSYDENSDAHDDGIAPICTEWL